MSRISRAAASKLIDNYVNFTAPFVDLNQTNNTWFSLQEIEDFIEYAKQEARNHNKPLTGFKIISGKYSGGEPRPTVLFMATTQGDGAEAEQTDLGFDLLNFGHNGKPPKIQI